MVRLFSFDTLERFTFKRWLTSDSESKKKRSESERMGLCFKWNIHMIICRLHLQSVHVSHFKPFLSQSNVMTSDGMTCASAAKHGGLQGRVGVVHAAVHFLFIFFKKQETTFKNHIILYKHGIIFTSRNKSTNAAEREVCSFPLPLQILHFSFLQQEWSQSSSSSKQNGTGPLTAPFDWVQDYTHTHTHTPSCGPVPSDCAPSGGCCW